MKVLVSFDDLHRSYTGVIARALRDLRPHLEVREVPLAELDRQLRFFEPHVVVCSQPSGAYHRGRGAWVEIPTEDYADDKRLAQICLDGEQWKTDGPPLREILEVIDQTQERLRQGRLSEKC